MKTVDKFLLHDLLKGFKKQKIAFYIDDICTYDKAMASIRMRCYDILLFLEKQGLEVELYKPWKRYQAVIFTKTREDKAVRVARELREKRTKVIFDAYCEFIADEGMSQNKERNNILAITALSDCVITCSTEQQKDFGMYHDKVKLIPESVHDNFFTVQKEHMQTNQVTLVYCGYSKKAKDTLCILDDLKWLQKKYNCKLLYLCEKDPEIKEIEYSFEKYEQSKIHEQLLQGDIMIAPRPMEGIEKLAHSFSKVAYPLSVGLPTVASPVPSYLNTPVIICENGVQWRNEISNLINNPKERQELGAKGRQYVYQTLSLEVIGKKYKIILEEMLHEA